MNILRIDPFHLPLLFGGKAIARVLHHIRCCRQVPGHYEWFRLRCKAQRNTSGTDGNFFYIPVCKTKNICFAKLENIDNAYMSNMKMNECKERKSASICPGSVNFILKFKSCAFSHINSYAIIFACYYETC